MKKYVYYLTIAVLSLLFSACQKNDQISTTDTLANGKQLLSRLTAIQDIQNTRLAYSTLTAQERHDVWIARFDEKIKSGEWSSQQIEKIKEFADHLALNVFVKGDKREIFFTSFFPTWMKSASKVFNDVEIYNLVFALKDIQPTNTTSNGQETNLVAPGDGGGGSCFCALHSGFTCPHWSLSPYPNLSWGTCLKSGACTQPAGNGCGALLDQECDGNSCPEDRA
ncbi:bacteriocin fulvocin C-related protein [Pedobacter sp.]|uniref:bacteriocin fulvocin C-related protein n=1 Tax=Pedobacter sp. TaxID=1411316 RepID=UPI00396C3AF1